MTTRFDVERAVLASDLPKLARLLMLVLLAHADNDPVEIPAKFTPSLTVLACETAMGRNTVQSILRDLETAGWVLRRRPPVEQSRKGVRTRYRLAVPVGHSATQLGHSATQPGSGGDLGVGREECRPRSRGDPMSTPPRSSTRSNPRDGARGSDGSRNGRPQPAWLDGAVDFVAERLTAATRNTYDRRDITDSVTGFLSGKKVTNPGAYIRKCADENPLQFEPTSMPQRFRKEDYQ